MRTRVIAVDAQGSVLFGGTAGARRLPGMGAGFVTDLSRRVQPDQVLRVSELECVAGARLLARREGILAGASTGAVVHAVASLLPQRPDDARIAMLVHDGGMPYLDTIYDDEWVRTVLGASPQQVEEAVQALQERARG